MAMSLPIGAEFYYKGLEFRIINHSLKEGKLILLAQRLNDLQIIELPLGPLLLDKTFIKKPVHESSSLSLQDLIEEKDRKQIKQRTEVIQPVLLLMAVEEGDNRSEFELREKFGELFAEGENFPSISKLVTLQATKHGISERTVWRYLELHNKFGPIGLLKKSNQQKKISSQASYVTIRDTISKEVIHTIPVRKKSLEQIQVIENVIHQEFLTKMQILSSVAIRKIKDGLTRNGLEKISDRTLYSILKQIPC